MHSFVFCLIRLQYRPLECGTPTNPIRPAHEDSAEVPHSLTHFRVPGQEKGTSENEVPGFVGAFTQTHINTRLVVTDRARRMRMSKTHTRTYEAPKS